MKPQDESRPETKGTISRKQQEAIAALLTHRTVEEAALAIGVGKVTIWRWMQKPSFSRAYSEARNRALETAISRLQALTSDAVEALRRNLTCGEAGDENRAALGILSTAFKGAELLGLEGRISDLEARQTQAAASLAKVG